MKILAVDIGAGTQDILLYDSHLAPENNYKLIMPAPTMIIHRRLKAATQRRQAVLLQGVTMGGGPSQWAAQAHIRAGLPIYATPQAARSFNDDLEAVQKLGVTLLSEDEARRMPEDVERIEMRDFDFTAIAQALGAFGVSLNDLAAVAVAVFDHGNAPQGYSDRQFRFDYLAERIQAGSRLEAFAFRAENIPPSLTRLLAIIHSAGEIDAPLVVMDTAPAAVLGATYDPQAARQDRMLVVNVGNLHTLAFRLGSHGAGGRPIEAIFEHHTGRLDQARLESLLQALAEGSLTHAAVFDDHGHGAWECGGPPLDLAAGEFGAIVTGPRQGTLRGSGLHPYFAAPFGDMMITGCVGLLAACATALPELGEAIRNSLSGSEAAGAAPWEV